MKFLEKELEDERRKSQADQDKIRKYENILDKKAKELEDAQKKFLDKDNNIKKLEKALDDERRKSCLD